MRILWKLSVIVLLGVAIQYTLARAAGEIDEAAFAFRVFVANLQGDRYDSSRLVDEAQRLFQRQCLRAQAAEGNPSHVQDVQLAFALDTEYPRAAGRPSPESISAGAEEAQEFSTLPRDSDASER